MTLCSASTERDPLHAARNIVGIRCGWDVFDAVAAGEHPKITCMRIREITRRVGRPLASQSAQLPDARYEIVTIRNQYFPHSVWDEFPQQEENIVDLP